MTDANTIHTIKKVMLEKTKGDKEEMRQVHKFCELLESDDKSQLTITSKLKSLKITPAEARELMIKAEICAVDTTERSEDYNTEYAAVKKVFDDSGITELRASLQKVWNKHVKDVDDYIDKHGSAWEKSFRKYAGKAF